MGLAWGGLSDCLCGHPACGLTHCHGNKVSLPRLGVAVKSFGGCEWPLLIGWTRRCWRIWSRCGSVLIRSRRCLLLQDAICSCCQALGNIDGLTGMKGKGNNLPPAVAVFDFNGKPDCGLCQGEGADAVNRVKHHVAVFVGRRVGAWVCHVLDSMGLGCTAHGGDRAGVLQSRSRVCLSLGGSYVE